MDPNSLHISGNLSNHLLQTVSFVTSDSMLVEIQSSIKLQIRYSLRFVQIFIVSNFFIII
jgi:hypothetical protein